MLDKEIDVFGDEEFSNMTEEQRSEVLSEIPSAAQSHEQKSESDGQTGEFDSEQDQNDETYDEAYDAMRDEARGELFSENKNEETPVVGEIIDSALGTMTESDEDAQEAIDDTHENKESKSAGSTP
jgi:hypothetical protein